MGTLRSVELDDEDESPTPAPARRARRWWIAAAAVAVLALLAGTQSVLDARHRRQEARFDLVAGVLQPVPEHLAVAWEAPDASSFLVGATTAGPHLVDGSVSDDRTSYTVREIDRGTGLPVWSVSGDLDPVVVAALAEPADASAAEPDAGDAYSAPLPVGPNVACQPLSSTGQVGCVVSARLPWEDAAAPVAAQVVVVDLADRTVVSSRATSLRTATTVGDAVVTATSSSSGSGAHATVTWMLDARDAHGRPRWTLTLPAVPAPAERSDDDVSVNQTDLLTLAGQVVLVDHGHVWVVRDGALVRDAAVGASTYVQAAHGGVLAAIAVAGGSSSAPDGTRFLLADGRWVSIAGSPVDFSVDDGSAAGLFLIKDEADALVGRDGQTGRTLWTSPAGDVSSAIILGGVIYVVVGNTSDATAPTVTLEAIEAATGKRLWAHPLMDEPSDLPEAAPPSSDGRALYVRWGTRLKAFGIDDGRRLPDRSLPDSERGDDSWVMSQSGLLVSVRSDPAGDTTGIHVLH